MGLEGWVWDARRLGYGWERAWVIIWVTVGGGVRVRARAWFGGGVRVRVEDGAGKGKELWLGLVSG